MTTKAKCTTLVAIGILGSVAGICSSTPGTALIGVLIAVCSFAGAATFVEWEGFVE